MLMRRSIRSAATTEVARRSGAKRWRGVITRPRGGRGSWMRCPHAHKSEGIRERALAAMLCANTRKMGKVQAGGSTCERSPAARAQTLTPSGVPSVQDELERRATCARGVEGVVVFLWVARGMRQSFEASYHPRQQTHIEQRFICVRRGPQGFALWYSITSSSAERGSQVSRF